jgi:fluoride exporter
MKQMVLVGLGGCLGAVARYKCGGWILHHFVDWRFPVGTFTVNAVGCLVAGVLAGLIERHHVFSADLRIFLFSGVLGGFTTFSAFGVETVFLLRRGQTSVALGYVALSIVCCVVGLWLGMAVIHPVKPN